MADRKSKVVSATGIASGADGARGVGAAVIGGRAMQVYAKGAAFEQGPKKPRQDALKRIIVKALAELPNGATVMQILQKCEELDGGKVIDRIEWDDLDGPVTEWHGGKSATETSFAALRKRVSRYRKKNRSP